MERSLLPGQRLPRAAGKEAALDDPRISRMYARLLGRHLTSLPRRVLRWIATHPSQASLLLIVVLLAAGGLALRERGRGHLSKLKSELQAQTPVEAPQPPQPGGQDPIVLQRSQMAGSTMPEFLSATLLPGRGMNTLQITAYLPDKGEVQLLASPTLDEAAKRLTGTGDDAGGAASLELGGAIELPWAGALPGVRVPEKDAVQASWHGHMLNLPMAQTTSRETTAVAYGGLLMGERASTVSSNVMPDGGESQAHYTAGSFGGRWPSKTDVTVTVLLSGRAVEIHVVAHNSGSEPEPIGIGWRPRFAVISEDRSQVRLHIPSSVRIERRDGSGLPTGRLLPVNGTAFDFTAREGTPLRTLDLEDTFVHLRPALLDIGPMLELRDPKSNYGLRLTAMTPTIRALRVESRPQTNVITVDPRFNYDDPFGREWSTEEDTGMVVLEPGKTTQWRIRLELFPLANTAATGL